MIKLTDILREILIENDYDDSQYDRNYLDQRRERLIAKIRKDVKDYIAAMEKKYGDSYYDEMSTEEKNIYSKLNKIAYGDSRMRGSFSMKAIHQWTMALKKLRKKYPNMDGIRGDIKSKYAYHYTIYDNLDSIFTSNTLYTSGGSVSLTTNKDLMKRKPTFWYGAVNHKTLAVKFVLDLQKIIRDGYEILVGDDDLGTLEGEEELRLRRDLKNLRKYIVKVIVYKSNISSSELKSTIDLLKQKNIPYYINTRDFE
jgi:hypothetical protein